MHYLRLVDPGSTLIHVVTQLHMTPKWISSTWNWLLL